ncbi:MAG: hypothetical protein IJ619_01160 [Eubacterium sp.]|nr:hypothetical protein [Eubacterium sp.]
MRKTLMKKQLISAVLALGMLLGTVGCGTKNTVVTDYGTTESSSETVSSAGDADTSSTKTDAHYELGNSESLADYFGDSVKWDETTAIDGTEVKLKGKIEVPELKSLNVYNAKILLNNDSWEDKVVKGIFGDSAEKLEEVSYTNSTDYMMLLYRLRAFYLEIELRNAYMGDGEETFDENFYQEMEMKRFSIINSSFDESYKWYDSEDSFLHMYEGEFQGKRYSLLIGYMEESLSRIIYLSPVSVEDIFPGEGIKSMLIENEENDRGVRYDYENESNLTPDDVKKSISDFLTDKVGFGANDICLSNNGSNFDALYGNYYYNSFYNDSMSVLTFTDSDYLTSKKSVLSTTSLTDYRILAEQDDIPMKAKDRGGSFDYYSYINSYNPPLDQVVNAKRNGYVMYLSSGYTMPQNMNTFTLSTGSNYGRISVTDKGIFDADIMYASTVLDVVENVKLLGLDNVREALKADMTANIDKYRNAINATATNAGDKLKNIRLDTVRLDYYPLGEEENDGENLTTFVPVWQIWLSGDNEGYVLAYINAIDGSIIDVTY